MKYGGTARSALRQMQMAQTSFDFNTVEIPKGYVVTGQVHDEVMMEQRDEIELTAANRCPCGHRGNFWSVWHELAFCGEKCYDEYVKIHGDGGTANVETKTNPV